MERSRRVRKVLAVVLTVVLLLGLIGWAWVRSVESSRWRRLELRVAELRLQGEERCRAHPVLRGTAEPGNAWDDYVQALENVRTLPDALTIKRFADRMEPIDRGRVEKTVEEFREAVERMRRGTRRAESRRMRFHDGQPLFELGAHVLLSDASKLTALAICRARLLWEGGKADEAAELLLDTARFGQDIVNDGSLLAQLEGFDLLYRVLLEMKELVCSRKAPASALAQIDRELEILDATCPSAALVVESQVELFGEMLLRNQMSELFGSPPGPELRDWRYCWSRKLLMTSAFDLADSGLGILREAHLLSCGEEIARWNRYHETLTAGNPYAGGFRSMTPLIHQARREHLTTLRLIRCAARYYATGELLELEDPFQSVIRHRVAPFHVTFWGVGRDGTNQAGTGSWPSNGEDRVLIVAPR